MNRFRVILGVVFTFSIFLGLVYFFCVGNSKLDGGCGRGARYLESVAQPESNRVDIGLQPYLIGVSQKQPIEPYSTAELLVNIKNLPGLGTTFSSTTWSLPRLFQGSTPKQWDRTHCVLASEAQKLAYPALSVASLNAAIGSHTTGFMAGRYVLAANIASVSERFASNSSALVAEEIGLGDFHFEQVKDRFIAIRADKLAREDLTLSFVGSGSGASYSDGQVRIPVAALKRIAVLDYLWLRQGSNLFEGCMGEAGGISQISSVYCANLKSRMRVHSGAEWKFPNKLAGISGVSRQRSMAQVAADWRSAYGHDFINAALDEIWNYLEAVAKVYSQNLTGCWLVETASLHKATEKSCDFKDLESGLYYVKMDASRIVRWYKLLLAHEFSHHFLKHSPEVAKNLAAKLFESRGRFDKKMNFACTARLILESEADVFAAFLLSQSNGPGDLIDYWGKRIEIKDASPADEVGYRMFVSWSPFFDGYAALEEDMAASCGYIYSKSRHVLFHTLFMQFFNAAHS